MLTLEQGWFCLVMGLSLMAVGCVGSLGELRSTWNVTNAAASDLQQRIDQDHQTDLDSIVEAEGLTLAQRHSGLDAVAEKWRPIYRAFRKLRAALAASRAVIVSAEVGQDPSPEQIARLIADMVLARKAVEDGVE